MMKREPRTPMYLHLPTALKQRVTATALTKKVAERDVVIAALEMYIAYTAAQPTPAPVTPERA